MIVAAVQIELPAGCWSREIAAIIAAVTRAAEHQPAPDLIVLPDCHDAALSTSGDRLLTPAMCQGFAEAVACQAREWGVWIAVGHALASAEGIEPVATLFDPDGDAYMRYTQHRVRAGASHDPSAADAWTICKTPLGVLGLITTAAWGGNGAKYPAPAVKVDLLILPAADSDHSGVLDGLAETARTTGSYACAAFRCVAGGRRQAGECVRSAMIDRQGKVVAKTRAQVSEVVMAELAICSTKSADGIDTKELTEIE